MLIYRMISKILEWLGLSKHHMNMKPENTRSYHTDFGAEYRRVMDIQRVAQISDLNDFTDHDYIDRLKTEIENLEGDMLGEEPGSDRYEMLQNEVDTLIDKLDNYERGDYDKDSEYDL